MACDSPIRFYLFLMKDGLEVFPMSDVQAAELCTKGTIYVASYASRQEAEAKCLELNGVNLPVTARAH
jgi:hypothetical protein